MKGIVGFMATPIRIPNHRAPNHRLAITGMSMVLSNWVISPLYTVGYKSMKSR